MQQMNNVALCDLALSHDDVSETETKQVSKENIRYHTTRLLVFIVINLKYILLIILINMNAELCS